MRKYTLPHPVQLYLALPVVQAPKYTLIERQGDAEVRHSFVQLSDAVTFVVIHANVPKEQYAELRAHLLSGREWITGRRVWKLTTETKR